METIETNLGMNRTGVLTSIKEAMKTKEGAESLTTPPPGDSSLLGENRVMYMQEGDPMGSVPIPMTVKGLMSSAQEKLFMGNHIFMDKLGERIAFERTGTRLYEALISKYQGTSNQEGLPDLMTIEQFYMEELKHFNMAAEIMMKLGGDPTAMTPSADIAGIAGMGWIQVINDPRTTFLQSLETILQAELVDNASWETLLELAIHLGLKEAVDEFTIALQEEEIHLETVKQWVKELNLDGKVSPILQ